MALDRFPMRIGRRSLPILGIWGVKAGLAYLEVGDGPDGEIAARFGRVRFNARLDNIVSWQIEGPFIWVKAIGLRRSLRHGDVSFAGSAHGGVRMDFRAPVRWSIFRVPALYFGADDLDALASALTARGISGRDLRQPPPTLPGGTRS
jgi:hypothetical protein